MAKDVSAPLDGRPVLNQTDQSISLSLEFEKAEHFTAQGKLNTALLQYNRILSLDPDNLDAKIGKGDIAITQGAYHEAFAIFSEAALYANEGVARREIDIGLTLALVLAEKSSDPKKDLKVALSMNPEDTRVLNALGRLADYDRDWVTAAEYYTRALETGDAMARVLNNIGISLTMQGRFPEAIEKFKQAQTIENVPETVAYNLSRAYILSGDYRRALSLSQAEDMPTLYNDAGVFALKQNRYALSKCLFKTAIEISSTYLPIAEENLQIVGEISREAANCAGLGNHASQLF